MPDLPAPPALDTGGFKGFLVPADVQGRVLSLLVDSAPFANSLTRRPTNSSTVVFPTASPSGAAWVGELGQIPLMSLGDDAHTVAVAKLAGLLDLSNELVSDASVNVTNTLGTLLGDSLSPQLDQGLLYGAGPPEPAGVVAAAPAVTTGADMLEAVTNAIGAISDAGGTADTVAAKGSLLAAENAQRDGGGALLYGPGGVAAGGFASTVGLKQVAVPGLNEVLVFDSRRLFLVLNGALLLVDRRDYRFEYDATTMRVKSRVAVGCPAPAKTIRKWVVVGTQAAQASASVPARKS